MVNQILNEGDYCPLCEIGTLVIKHSKYGEFLGCNKYPSCTYIHKGQRQELSETEKLNKQADEFLIKHGKGHLVRYGNR